MVVAHMASGGGPVSTTGGIDATRRTSCRMMPGRTQRTLAPAPRHARDHDADVRRRVAGCRHPPRPMWATNTDHHHTPRTGTTHGHYQPALRPPPSDLVEYGPLSATDHHPAAPPWFGPEPARERALHARTAHVTKRIRVLHPKTYPAGYCAPRGDSKPSVSDF